MFRNRTSLRKRVRDLEEKLSDTCRLMLSFEEQLQTVLFYHDIKRQLNVDLSMGFDIEFNIIDTFMGRCEDDLIKHGYEFYGKIEHFKLNAFRSGSGRKNMLEIWARPSKKLSAKDHFGPNPGDG